MKVAIIGHFAFGHTYSDGQTIKTHNVYNALSENIGKHDVMALDTYGGLKFFIRMSIVLYKALAIAKNIIILPAHRGIRIIVPSIVLLNIFFRRKLHYCVIGGWLPNLIAKKPLLRFFLKQFHCIYVETSSMLKALQNQGFRNIIVMPNFKNIPIRSIEEITTQKFTEPYPLCTFSRVNRKKGIEDAVKTIKDINEQLQREVFSLDIYGSVSSEEQEWFENLKKTFTPNIHYKGCTNSEQSVSVLSKYFALLFPTQYYTEGIPGTILDAYAAGLPVISAQWQSFSDIIDNEETGIGYKFDEPNQLKDILLDIVKKPKKLTPMRYLCIQKAQSYQPKEVINILIKQLI